MRATATLKYERTAPRKLRVVARTLRGKPVGEAINTLMFCGKDAARVIKKLLVSAIANAEDKSKGAAETDHLVIREITVDQGPPLKRWRPRAMGRASRITKHTSHIRVVVEDQV